MVIDEIVRSKDAFRITLVGTVVNAVLILVKFSVGFWGHSQALIADAFHSLSDFLSDLVVLAGIKIGGKAPDEGHPFGHGRLETLASAFIGVILAVVALELALDAATRLYQHDTASPSWMACVAAALSIVCKELLYRYTIRVGRRLNSPVIMANAWHHRSDALSSIAVLVGVTATLIQPEWHFFDSLAALIVAALLLKVGVDILWNCFRELIDAAPEQKIIDEIEYCALAVEGVREIHDLRVRTMGGQYQMELHAVVDGALTVEEGHRIAKEIEKCLLDEIKNSERIIVHIDPDEN